MRRSSSGVHRRNDFALGDAVAVADLRVVGQVFHVQRRTGVGGQREQQLGAIFRQRFLPIESLEDARHGEPVAQQDCALHLAIAHDDLLVDVAVGLDVGNHFVVVGERVLVAGYGQLYAHNLQLGGYAGAVVAGVGVAAGQPLVRDAGLLPQGGDQAVNRLRCSAHSPMA